jgi:hypothetical protein
MNTKETQQVMKDKMNNNKDQMKVEINELAIAQQIKSQLENSNINVVITPIMYDPNTFTPVLGVLVKNEDSSYTRKYTITVKPNN